MTEITIPVNHPRAMSLQTREKLIEGYHQGLVAEAGLIAHGRGEAFDYILGEKTHPFAITAAYASAALALASSNPVISVNGNAAALCSRELVELSEALGARLEVNLFYRSRKRLLAIEAKLRESGAREVCGVDPTYYASLGGLESMRRTVDVRGILTADTVIVPLEDGDRTITLKKMGKRVVAIDLNPFSRTAQEADITIVDNITRAVPQMIAHAARLKEASVETLRDIVSQYRNQRILGQAISYLNDRLSTQGEVHMKLRIP